jgi:cytochrome c
MKGLKVALLVVISVSFLIPLAFAGDLEDSIARGEALFKDRRAFGGNRPCDSCHPDGRGLERAATKKRFWIMGNKAESLEEAVNLCIENANRGNPIGVNSEQMEDMVNYIKSL